MNQNHHICYSQKMYSFSLLFHRKYKTINRKCPSNPYPIKKKTRFRCTNCSRKGGPTKHIFINSAAGKKRKTLWDSSSLRPSPPILVLTCLLKRVSVQNNNKFAEIIHGINNVNTTYIIKIEGFVAVQYVKPLHWMRVKSMQFTKHLRPKQGFDSCGWCCLWYLR